MLLSKTLIEEILNKNNISFDEMKEIAKYAINEEKKKDNLEVPITFLSIGEYYKSDIFKKRIKLQKIDKKVKALTTPFNCNGLHAYSEIFVFTNKIDRIFYLNKDNQLINLLKTSFHEYSHHHQLKNNNDYGTDTKFYLDIEDFIDFNSSNFYNKYYDVLLSEIIADFSGLIKTRNFLKQFPKYYEKHKSKIDKDISFYKICLEYYSFSFFLNKLHEIVLTGNFDFEYKIESFYKSNTSEFKSIIEIIKKHSLSISYKILTSEAYIKNLNLPSLELWEISFIKKLLENSLIEEKNKIQNIKTYLQKNNYIFDKIRLLYKLRIILNENANRIVFLEDTLTKLNELIENKNVKHTK